MHRVLKQLPRSSVIESAQAFLSIRSLVITGNLVEHELEVRRNIPASVKCALRMTAPINRVNQSFEEHARECTRETYENVF